MKLKPLDQQVVVVTGASSGIGRESAVRLSGAGATIVALSRSEEHLSTLVDEIAERGGKSRYIVCDVTDMEQVQAAADLTERWFGRIDTWVNNAGLVLYGEFWRTTPEEFSRVMEVNYLGQIHGALAALPALRRAGGGALLSVTSVEAFLTMPLHSAYAASKSALEGAMDGLRRDLIAEGIPVSVTTIRPGVIDTPIYPSARNHMDFEPQAPPPFYDPAIVAECIVYAATHPVRSVIAGGAASLLMAAQAVAPRTIDRLLGRFAVRFMHTKTPADGHGGNLYVPRDTGAVRGGLPRRGSRVSGYTWLILHPRVRLALTASALAGGLAAVVRRVRR